MQNVKLSFGAAILDRVVATPPSRVVDLNTKDGLGGGKFKNHSCNHSGAWDVQKANRLNFVKFHTVYQLRV